MFLWWTSQKKKKEKENQILTSNWLHNVQIMILIWSQCGHSPSFSLLPYFFIEEYLENKAPAHEMWSLNGLKISWVETPLIAPFHSILKPVKGLKLRFVQKGLTANTTMEIARTKTSLMCFCLTLPRPLFTQRRETHWVQLLWNIWASQSLTHLHCCSRQPSPAAALVHHAVPPTAQQGPFAGMEISVWICSV